MATALQRVVLRTAVALPLATLCVTYLLKTPSWPTIHPSAVFDHGTPRVVATLGFSMSAPFMACFGLVRYARDEVARDGEQRVLRALVFTVVVAGLLWVAAVPWHVSHAVHTASAITFFSAASLDLVVQHAAHQRRCALAAPGAATRMLDDDASLLARGALSRCPGPAVVGAIRGLGLVLCLVSILGQVIQSHPMMGVGEVGFAVVYLLVLVIEERELESISVQLRPGVG
eukprot:COSAG01_NODE_1707_length_9427_cov_12.173027_1_plen_230_part_00